QKQNAGSFGRLRTGSSTAQFANCANSYSTPLRVRMTRSFWLVGFYSNGKTKDNGKNKNNGKCKSEMRGSLHCATDDETVHRFGRDDAVRGWAEGKRDCSLAAS